eukprot:5723622-Prymnesium_polylepis.1
MRAKQCHKTLTCERGRGATHVALFELGGGDDLQVPHGAAELDVVAAPFADDEAGRLVVWLRLEALDGAHV